MQCEHVATRLILKATVTQYLRRNVDMYKDRPAGICTFYLTAPIRMKKCLKLKFRITAYLEGFYVFFC